MAGTQKEVEFIRPWQTYRVGERIKPNGTHRDWLVANGYAKVIEAAAPERPARFSAKAAQKISQATKNLLG